jgi:RNA polymerase sigma-32 factor
MVARTHRKSTYDTTPLPRELQEDLAVRAQQGDLEASDRLVASNMRWIWQRSQRYRGTLAPEEAMQEGVIGFLKAVQKFTPGRSSIQTYSDWWIRCFVQRAAASNGIVKVWTTSSLRAARTEIYREAEDKGTSPIDVLADPGAVTRIAESCSVSERTVVRLRAGFAPKVGESFIGNGPGHLGVSPCEEEAHPAEAETGLLSQESHHLVHKALDLLAHEDSRMAQVLRRHFADPPVTLQDLGDQMGLSRERVRQIEIRARPRFAKIYRQITGEPEPVEAPVVVQRRASVREVPAPAQTQHADRRSVGGPAPLAASQVYEEYA